MMSYFIVIGVVLRVLLPAWLMDRLFGDPVSLPHPVIWFGKMIAFGEKRLNKGSYKLWKGGIMSVLLILFVYSVTIGIEYALSFLGTPAVIGFDIICIFFCLAGTTLIKEVRMVFEAVDRSLEEGRIQVARIVGRDTSELSAQEVRTAALETLAENLSDGVIAPLFWYLLLGVPGMMAYKMVNTLDSMIGYHSDRYLLFGRVAARVDDVANYIPARLTAVAGSLLGISLHPLYSRCEPVDMHSFRAETPVICEEIWQGTCKSQFRLSGSRSCRYPELSFRRSSSLFWSTLYKALYRSE